VARQFFSPEAYGPKVSDYQLLPFRFTRLNGREILVNECGEFLFAPRGTVQNLVGRKLDTTSDLYASLRSRQFITDGNSSAHLDLLATKYRTKHEFLLGSTKLHIFVVTLKCDHSCLYCQVSRQTAEHDEYDMSYQTAEKSVDLMMGGPSEEITLELQGGESLLAFEKVKFIVGLAKEKAANVGKKLQIVITTNLANVTDEILNFLKKESILVSTSLDGPEFIHNANRPRPGNNSHEITLQNIDRCRVVLGQDRVSALMTTTRLSLQHPIEIIDEYVRLGFHSVFLRPISPYGFAIRTAKKIGYETDAFLEFYKKGLAHILELNRNGYFISEVYTKILLTKILTPHGTGYVDLQSPAGAGFNVLIYNYDGDVYVSDESRMLAEMGDTTFRIGNVHQHSRRELFTGEPFVSLMDAYCNQSLPGCSDCAFQSYCGSDPIFNYATQGDPIGHRATSAFCKRNMGVIKHIFGLLAEGDPTTLRILWGWLTNRDQTEMSEELPV
jgi:His-Xaa-Ser system radical SAM maturase HxsB